MGGVNHILSLLFFNRVFLESWSLDYRHRHHPKIGEKVGPASTCLE